jgi:hypothetical protein
MIRIWDINRKIRKGRTKEMRIVSRKGVEGMYTTKRTKYTKVLGYPDSELRGLRVLRGEKHLHIESNKV